MDIDRALNAMLGDIDHRHRLRYGLPWIAKVMDNPETVVMVLPVETHKSSVALLSMAEAMNVRVEHLDIETIKEYM